MVMVSSFKLSSLYVSTSRCKPKYHEPLVDDGSFVNLGILIDTKYEFGKGADETIYLIDEVLHHLGRIY
ncbi:hypothetical protein C5167_016509 [Papaver somniferum]|nr:hypothetical protein C5167_016509 [Papaver somniferum]